MAFVWIARCLAGHPVAEHPVVEHPVVEHPVIEHPAAELGDQRAQALPIKRRGAPSLSLEELKAGLRLVREELHLA